jgi:hypothetical protein
MIIRSTSPHYVLTCVSVYACWPPHTSAYVSIRIIIRSTTPPSVLAGGCTTSVYVSSYSGVYCCYTCVRILLCPHTTVSAYYCVLILVYMSSYSGVYCCYTCVRILLCPYTTMCPHTSICVLVLRCVLLLYMCVVKQVYMCPHTTAIHVSAYYCVSSYYYVSSY